MAELLLKLCFQICVQHPDFSRVLSRCWFLRVLIPRPSICIPKQNLTELSSLMVLLLFSECTLPVYVLRCACVDFGNRKRKWLYSCLWIILFRHEGRRRACSPAYFAFVFANLEEKKNLWRSWSEVGWTIFWTLHIQLLVVNSSENFLNIYLPVNL